MISLRAILAAVAVMLFLVACDNGQKPYGEAELLFSKSDYAGARGKAMEVIEKSPKSKYVARANVLKDKIDTIKGLLGSAEKALESKEYKASLKDFGEILKIDAKSSEAIEGIKRAKESYRTSLFQEIGPYVEKGDYVKVIELYREIVTIFPADTEAVSRLNEAQDEYKAILLQKGSSNVTKGLYMEGINAYKKVLAFYPDDSEAIGGIKDAEGTLSKIKALGDLAMINFRIYIRSRGSRYYQQAETSRVQYLEKRNALYKIKGGKGHLRERLKAYLAEVEKALEKFETSMEVFQEANASGDYDRKVLAADKYNKTLNDFVVVYGRPEAWYEGEGRHLLREKIVDQWM